MLLKRDCWEGEDGLYKKYIWQGNKAKIACYAWFIFGERLGRLGSFNKNKTMLDAADVDLPNKRQDKSSQKEQVLFRMFA